MTLKPTPPKPDVARVEAAIAKLAVAYPDVTEESPWGHRAFKVRGKTFLFMGADSEALSFSVKLPHSGAAALDLPFTEPTHYGLGKSGWVSARFTSGKDVPLPLVKTWLDESFRAIAPKKLLATLQPDISPTPSKKQTIARQPPSAPARARVKTSAKKATAPASARAKKAAAAPARAKKATKTPASRRAKTSKRS